MSFERILLAVQGYIELDMAEEALREIALIDPVEQIREDVLQLKLFILMRMKAWGEALEICKLLQESSPEMTSGYIHGAFCLHEIGQTHEAKEMLLEGPQALLKEPTYYYNLACYCAILGELEEARKNLHASFKMDEKFREIAKYDPDLKLIHHLI